MGCGLSSARGNVHSLALMEGNQQNTLGAGGAYAGKGAYLQIAAAKAREKLAQLQAEEDAKKEALRRDKMAETMRLQYDADADEDGTSDVQREAAGRGKLVAPPFRKKGTKAGDSPLIPRQAPPFTSVGEVSAAGGHNSHHDNRETNPLYFKSNSCYNCEVTTPLSLGDSFEGRVAPNVVPVRQKFHVAAIPCVGKEHPIGGGLSANSTDDAGVLRRRHLRRRGGGTDAVRSTSTEDAAQNANHPYVPGAVYDISGKRLPCYYHRRETSGTTNTDASGDEVAYVFQNAADGGHREREPSGAFPSASNAGSVSSPIHQCPLPIRLPYAPPTAAVPLESVEKQRNQNDDGPTCMSPLLKGFAMSPLSVPIFYPSIGGVAGAAVDTCDIVRTSSIHFSSSQPAKVPSPPMSAAVALPNRDASPTKQHGETALSDTDQHLQRGWAVPAPLPHESTSTHSHYQSSLPFAQHHHSTLSTATPHQAARSQSPHHRMLLMSAPTSSNADVMPVEGDRDPAALTLGHGATPITSAIMDANDSDCRCEGVGGNGDGDADVVASVPQQRSSTSQHNSALAELVQLNADLENRDAPTRADALPQRKKRGPFAIIDSTLPTNDACGDSAHAHDKRTDMGNHGGEVSLSNDDVANFNGVRDDGKRARHENASEDTVFPHNLPHPLEPSVCQMRDAFSSTVHAHCSMEADTKDASGNSDFAGTLSRGENPQSSTALFPNEKASNSTSSPLLQHETRISPPSNHTRPPKAQPTPSSNAHGVQQQPLSISRNPSSPPLTGGIAKKNNYQTGNNNNMNTNGVRSAIGGQNTNHTPPQLPQINSRRDNNAAATFVLNVCSMEAQLSASSGNNNLLFSDSSLAMLNANSGGNGGSSGPRRSQQQSGQNTQSTIAVTHSNISGNTAMNASHNIASRTLQRPASFSQFQQINSACMSTMGSSQSNHAALAAAIGAYERRGSAMVANSDDEDGHALNTFLKQHMSPTSASGMYRAESLSLPLPSIIAAKTNSATSNASTTNCQHYQSAHSSLSPPQEAKDGGAMHTLLATYKELASPPSPTGRSRSDATVPKHPSLPSVTNPQTGDATHMCEFDNSVSVTRVYAHSASEITSMLMKRSPPASSSNPSVKHTCAEGTSTSISEVDRVLTINTPPPLRSSQSVHMLNEKRGVERRRRPASLFDSSK